MVRKYYPPRPGPAAAEAGAGEGIPVSKYPALVLNADFTPLSYVPLSLWSWQDTIRACLRDAVTVVDTYDVDVRSPSLTMALPSVIVLKRYIPQRQRDAVPAFSHRNLCLRDKFQCQYCAKRLPAQRLTCDHVRPQSKGGATGWENCVAACPACNVRKGSLSLAEIKPLGMRLARQPFAPSWYALQRNAREFQPQGLHEDWADYMI